MITAVVIGLAGSLHCMGMCGPIMTVFMGKDQKVSTFLIYHSGRIFSYLIIGLFLGLIAESINLLNVQKVVSLGLGAAILLLYLIPNFRRGIEKAYYESSFYARIHKLLSKNLSIRKKWFISGIANGFLPCGLTYVAAAGAIATAGLSTGWLFMLLFGLGTLPAFTLLSFGVSWFSKKKSWTKISQPAAAVIAGLILLMRGLLLTFPDFQHLVRMKAAGLITLCGV